jgi:C-terminal processing protease CtpA/Prc
MRRLYGLFAIGPFAIGLLAAALPTVLHAQNDSLRSARLTALGRLFGVVKYFHPAFLERDVPWDSAVAATVETVSALKTTEEYRAAIAKLLKSVGDPATQVMPARTASVTMASSSPKRSARWDITGADSTLIVTIPDFTDYVGVQDLLNQTRPDIIRAPHLVFDLRGDAPDETGNASFEFAGIQAALPSSPVSAPAQRMRMHSGLAPQTGGSSGGYWSGTYEKTGAPIPFSATKRVRRIVFLVNPGSDIPDVAFALASAGQGSIIVEGATSDLVAAGNAYPISMGEDVVAMVRVADLIGFPGADTVVSPGDRDAALHVALAFSKRQVAPRGTSAPRSTFVPAPETAYPAMRNPSRGYRILAGYRYWNAIYYFYPYKRLIGEDWGHVLPRITRMLDSARDSLELGMALAKMVTFTNDSHSGVTSNTALGDYLGTLWPAVRLQYVPGMPVVVRIGDDSATKASGLAVGDVIVRVDGEDAAARRARMATFVAHSTPQALDDGIAGRLLRGNDTLANLVVRGADNRERSVRLPRRPAFRILMQYPRAGPVMKMLPGNVGYADLSLLTPAMTDSMFEVFKNTKGIILDDRGYPQGTAWSIAPRLSAKPVPAAAFQRPLVTSPDSSQWSTFHFVQSTPPGTKPVYRGKTILLVDERTISQAEHTGLFFEAANKTAIVGSPTMGANGDVTTVALVGGMYATFTGHDVRHADGRQLQRVGLQPDVVVRPTLAGIRAGRDEVLERARALLSAAR